jgi:hypothetical protein
MIQVQAKYLSVDAEKLPVRTVFILVKQKDNGVIVNVSDPNLGCLGSDFVQYT